MTRRALIVGTSPGARVHLDALWATDFEMVLTANAGCHLVPNPTHYMLYDSKAAKLYERIYRAMQGNGTKLVRTVMMKTANSRDNPLYRKAVEQSLRTRSNYDDFAWFLPWPGECQWEPGTYVQAKRVGVLMLQYAANSGADEIHVAGCQGFTPPGNYEAMMAFVPTRVPMQRFVFHGPLTYEGHLRGANVAVQS